MTQPAPTPSSATDLLLGVALAVVAPSARFAQFAAVNRADIADPSSLVRVALATAVLAAAATVVLGRLTRLSPLRAGAAVGVVGLLAFTADPLGDSPVLRPLAWCALAALAVVGVADLASRRWAAVTLLAALVATTAWFGRLAVIDAPVVAPITPSSSDVAPIAAERPDVFLFVVDAFGRPDELARQLDVDLDGFVTQLTERGFDVDPRATANYPETLLSVPSLLDQTLPITTEDPASEVRGIDRRPTVNGANRTVRQLAARGYRYVQADPGVTDQVRCDPAIADACVASHDASSGWSLDEVGAALLDASPLGPLLRGRAVDVGAAADPVGVVDAVHALDDELGGDPVFVYSHILAPHPPFRLRADCAAREPATGGLASPWTDDVVDDYAEQALCTAAQLIEATDRIIRRDPDAIIVIIGDHGSGFDVPYADLSEWSDDAVRQRFSVLRALRMPAACRTDDPRASSSVNTLRMVVACTDGTAPDLVEPRAFLTLYDSDHIEELPEAILEPR